MRLTKGVDEKSKVKDALRRFQVLKEHNFDSSIVKVDPEFKEIQQMYTILAEPEFNLMQIAGKT